MSGGFWVLTQLAGPKKVLRLEGWSAPHGRPGRDPVTTDRVSLREESTYYPGSDVPTRHVFGAMLEPLEISGRFSDRMGGGLGWSVQMVEYVKGFLRDAQPILVEWADVIVVQGLLTEFEPGRESFGEVAWKAKIKVDVDMMADVAGESQPEIFDPVQSMLDLNAAIMMAWDDSLELPQMKISLLDAFANLVGSINGFFASINNVVQQVKDFKDAAVGELRRLRAGIRQLRTAIIKAKRIWEDLTVDLAIQSSQTGDSIAFCRGQTRSGSAVMSALKILDSIDDAAETAQRGRIKGIVVANTLDTWATMAMRSMGSADRAADLQAANGVTGPPVVGDEYIVPE